MKTKTSYRFLTLFFILLTNNVIANTKVDEPVTINVDTAGTLSALLGDQVTSVKHLILLGSLNGSDIKTIRNMSSLTILDMLEANMVSGGDYYGYGYSANNVIGSGAFTELTKLTSITIPKSVTSIRSYAFYNCIGLTSIKMQDSIMTIADHTFGYCTGLKTINLPPLVNSIQASTFEHCSALTTIKLSENITDIGNAAFTNCSGLTSITMPNSVVTIGFYAFNGCTGLDSITISNKLSLIKDYAFEGCSSLTSITIPEGVTSIGNRAFWYCTNLKSISLPNSLTSISTQAFTACSRITEIHSNALIPAIITSSTFSSVNISTCKLYVPVGTTAAYQSSTGWASLKNIIEESIPSPISNAKVDNIIVFSEKDAIVINGAKLGDDISVFSISGYFSQRVKVQKEMIRIIVPANNIYLVQIKEKTFKVSLIN